MEVMMFLAVSGFMFVIAATFISGKQAKAEFRQGMTSANTAIQGVINDVNNGFYPSSSNFSCFTDSSGNPPSFHPPQPGSNTQGTKLGCVFMGKVMMFGGVPDAGRGYSVLTMAGRQYAKNQNPPVIPLNFAQANPAPVTGNPAWELTQKSNFEGGMRIIKVFNDSPTNKLDGIGFYSSFGSYDTGGTLEAGAQHVVIVGISGSSTFNPSLTQMASEAQTGSKDTNVLDSPNITMCFDSGTGQFGTIVLGGPGGQRLATKMQIYNSKPVYC